MLKLIAIDPGKRIGWALADGGRMVDCGTIGDYRDLPKACCAIVEMPRVYPNPMKWKGDPQQIVRLAALAGQIAAGYPLSGFVEPRRWRGMAPEKAVRHRTLKLLTPFERLLLSEKRASVHAWDAVGILLFSLARRINVD